MYQISVPLMLDNVEHGDQQQLIKMLRQMEAKRVFLVTDICDADQTARRTALKHLKKQTDFFHSEGFEVGTWTLTLAVRGRSDFTYMTAVDPEERVFEGTCCPSDETFREFFGDYAAELAACGVDLIMLDDDLRFAFMGPFMGCLCENHVRMIEEITGESLPRAELAKRILSGGKNKYRDAWLTANGMAMESFAVTLRKKIDAVNPTVRLGTCACLGSWDLDGTDAKKLAYLFAGQTKPFVRLIGAPYWAATNSKGCALQDVIELERMESAWTRDENIEIMAEGDTYPRPRLSCPASYLEGFDLAMRASGATDGILKYTFDYNASITYETGYVKAHVKNASLYPQVDELFRNKKAMGVRVYEFPRKIADMDAGDGNLSASVLQNTFLCTSERTLAACSVPTTYEGEGVCGICFGQSARYLTPEMRKRGMILDAEAAAILHGMGVDVGIDRLGEPISTTMEHFPEDGETVITGGIKVFRHTLKPAARICSMAETTEGSLALSHMKDPNALRVPMSYLYENDSGERFFVLNLNTRFVSKNDSTIAMRHDKRSQQYATYVPWLSHGSSLPAFCGGNPNLYTMVKEQDGSLSVGLWNFFADPVDEPVIELARDYRAIRFLGCTGSLSGRRVTLSPLPAYGFAAFEVK